MSDGPTFRLVAVNPEGSRTVVGTRLTEAQAKAIIELLSQGNVASQIVVESEQSWK